MSDLRCGRNELGYARREDGRKRRKRRTSVGELAVEEEEGGRRRKVCWKEENLWRGSCSNQVWLLCVKGGTTWNLVAAPKPQLDPRFTNESIGLQRGPAEELDGEAPKLTVQETAEPS